MSAKAGAAFARDPSYRSLARGYSHDLADNSPSAQAAVRHTPQSTRKSTAASGNSRTLTCRKTAVPPSPGLHPPTAAAEDSFSMLLDTSLGAEAERLARSPAKGKGKGRLTSPRKKRPPPPPTSAPAGGVSPMKNFYFATDLRRISELPAIEADDEDFLDQLDTSELERLAWETMELEQKAAKRSSSRRSTSAPEAKGTAATPVLPARSREAGLSMLQESSEEAENIAPFVQLTRGRSGSKSPRKARGSTLSLEATTEEKPACAAASKSPALLQEKTNVIKHDAALTARQPFKRPSEEAAAMPTRSSKARKSATTQNEVSRASMSPLKRPAPSVATKPTPGSSISRRTIGASARAPGKAPGPFSRADKVDVGSSLNAPADAPKQQADRTPAPAEEPAASTGTAVLAVEATSVKPPSKLPTQRGSRVSLSAAPEARTERRGRSNLETMESEVAPRDTSPPSRGGGGRNISPARSSSPQRVSSQSRSTTKAKQDGDDHGITQQRGAVADEPSMTVSTEQVPPEAASNSSRSSPTTSRTTRRRSARLSLKEAEASPPRPAAVASAKQKASSKKPLRPSLTVPAMAMARKEAAVQRSAVAQMRKTPSHAQALASSVPPATKPKGQSAASTRSANSSSTSAKPETSGGRTLRNRKSLSAPSAVPMTVIGGKFRQTANGELVPITSLASTTFQLSTDARGAQHATVSQQRLERQEEERKRKSTYKANPVPEWMRQRKLQLEREEEERLQAEIEEARQLELANRKKRRVASSSLAHGCGSPSKKAKTQPVPFVSSVDARMAERQAWEEKRKRKEAILDAEREKARREREMLEEEEYREARKRSVIKANPIPEYLGHLTTSAAAVADAGGRGSSTRQKRASTLQSTRGR